MMKKWKVPAAVLAAMLWQNSVVLAAVAPDFTGIYRTAAMIDLQQPLKMVRKAKKVQKVKIAKPAKMLKANMMLTAPYHPPAPAPYHPAPAPAPAPYHPPTPTPTPPHPTPTPTPPHPTPTPTPPHPTPTPPHPAPAPHPHPQPPLPPVIHPQPGQPGHGQVVPKPKPINNGIDEHHAPGQIQHPAVGPDNKPISQRPLENGNHRVIPPGNSRLEPMMNRGIEDQIRRENQGWNANDRGYYWRDWGGYRMCHHFDGRFNWWGFYLADVYFWSVYYNDNYWWYDPYWHRWCYMHNGSWWWQTPDGVIYIYRDGLYYEYNDTVGGVVLNPDTTPPVEPPPADPTPAPTPDQQGKTFYSADGSRMVQVVGDDKQAYLYDTADPPAFDSKYLDSGVTEVRFKSDEDGTLASIMTLRDDGGFSLFDQDGNPLATVPTTAPVSDDGQGDQGTTTSSVGKGLDLSALKTGNINW
jgi:hypothetical protein